MARPRHTLLAALVCLAALGLGACGDDDSGGDSADAKADLIAALSPEAFEGIESGVLDIGAQGEVTGEDGGKATASLTGPFDSQGQADLEGSIEVDSDQTSFELDGFFVGTTDNIYFGTGSHVYELGTDRFQALEAMSKEAGYTAGDPVQSLTAQCKIQIRAAGGDPSVCDELHPSEWIASAADEGTEEIDGVETRHLRGELDIGKLFDDGVKVVRESLPPGQAAALEAFGDLDAVRDKVEDVIEEASIEVNSGVDDGLTRRVALNLVLDAEGETARLALDVTLNDLNQPQTITAPEGAKPVESLRNEIPFFFQPLFDCFLNARSAADLNACGTQLGGLGGTSAPSSI